MKTKSGQKGFTLVEVMVVVALIGILTAIAVPAVLTWLPNMRLKAAARDLYSNMQKTRMNAIRANQPWTIVFEPANGRYLIRAGDGTIRQTVTFADYRSGVGFGHGSITGNNSATTRPGAFPADGVSYDSPDNVVTFNGRGTGTAGYVYLENVNQDATVYAVGTQTSGVIMLRKWTGGGWE